MTKNVSVPEGYKKTELGVIPEDWEVAKLSDVCSETLSGGTPSTSKMSYWGGDIPWMTSANILNMYINNGQKYITEEGLRNSASKVIPKNNVIVATRVGLGKVAINLIDVSISQDLTGLIINKKKADSIFLYWILKLYESKIIAYAQGTTIKGILKTDLLNIKLPLPPLSYQQKIASILSKVDEQIEQTEQIIEKTELLKKGLMQKLLTKGIGHTKFKNTELGEIPEEWDIAKVNEFCDVTTGGTPSTKNKSYWDGDIPWMSSGEINKKFIYDTEKKITKQGLENSNARILPKDTVMMALNGQGKTRGTVAVLKIPSTCNQSLACLIPYKNKCHYLYLYYNLQKRYSEIRNYTGNTGREGLNLKIIKDISIPFPPVDEQQKIVSVFSKVDSQIQDNQSYLTKLQELKKGLMQDLLTGKVKVCV